MSVTVLITGANRGIGHGLLTRALALPNHTIIAAVRNPEHETVKALSALPVADGSKLVVVKLDISIWQDAFDAVKALEAKGIDHLDGVIANAVLYKDMPTLADVKLDDLRTHMETNAFSVVSLYQAFRPLLQKSTKKPEPIFVTMGSAVGRMSAFISPNGSYGPSKAAAHWIGTQMNGENEWLNAFVISPGFVETDSGYLFAKQMAMPEEVRKSVMITRDVCCDGIINVIASTSKAQHGGELVEYSGNILEW